MLGAGGIGKSAFTIQFVKGNFVDLYDPTIEDSYQKNVTIDNKLVDLEILDTAGQEEFAMMREQFMVKADGFLMMYAINTRASFDDLQRFRDQALHVQDTSKFPMILVANKCDLPLIQRRVSVKEGQELAKEWDIPFFESSAKTATNVSESFFQLVREIIRGQTFDVKSVQSSDQCCLVL